MVKTATLPRSLSSKRGGALSTMKSEQITKVESQDTIQPENQKLLDDIERDSALN